MEYINEFHKEWIERTRQSVASWNRQPASLEEAKKQQERLNMQKAIRESKWKDTPIRSLEYRFLVSQVHVIAGSSL